MNQTGAPLVGFYDLRLIALSFLIAILASYVALDLAVRVMVGRGTVRRAWLAGGAILMGVGIWSRPLVGMLAFTLPIPVRYDVPTVLLPLLVAILASVIGLEIASGARFIRREGLAGSLVLGSGIAAMHCLGMAVMRLPATCHGNPLLLGLSAVIAVVASLAARSLCCTTAALRRRASCSLLFPSVCHVWDRRMCLCVYRGALLPEPGSRIGA
jgi:NO-binding membrane sensor protein with MHYT domain